MVICIFVKKKMKRIHLLSGTLIATFVLIHLINHTFSLFGATAHIELMDSLRVVYRNVIVESILLLAIVFQVFSGIKLFIKKRKTAKHFFDKLQVYSGLYIVLFFVIHLTAVFSGRFILKLDTNFYFGVAGLNTFPINLFFIPYYSLAIFSFFGHIAVAHYKKTKEEMFGLKKSQRSFLIILFGVLLNFVILYGLTNKFKGVVIPKSYNVLIGK